ncbi:MAG: ABC transporter ATP-binding protein [Bacteroidetes bacterium]|nr:MAG: ABC transporter ATP-binding protein [Bacteroidota bacterium]
MKSLFYLNKYLWKYKWRLLLGVFFVSISNVFAIFPAQVIRHAFNLIKENVLIYNVLNGFAFQSEFYDYFFQILLIYGGLILLFAVLKGIFMFFMRQTIIVVSRFIEYDLKNEIYEHYQLLDASFYKSHNTGDLMNRISEDVSRVRMYLGPAIMYTINLLVLFALVIFTMLTINVKLTLYVLTPLPLLSFIIYRVSGMIHKKSEAVQGKLSDLSTIVQEVFSGIRVVKSYNKQQVFIQDFEQESNIYKKLNLDLAQVNALFMPTMILLIGISTILTVYVGGLLTIDGQITTGNIAEFVIYVNMLTWPVASVGWVTSLVQRAAASQKRINEFLKTQPKIKNESEEHFEIKGHIEFKNVSFIYPHTGIRALHNVSFAVPEGRSLGIIGKTGSGKTTIASLILRLYDVTEGEILVDHRNIKKINLYDLRKAIGYVPQDSFLFSDTIANNIAFGNPAAEGNRDLIEKYAKIAHVHENIIHFPKGYETVVGERGITLSGGQKQRIAIARALIKQPKILILDDCLSAVDSQTEEHILRHLKEEMKGKTSIIISHRISSVMHCDNIIALERGQIIEQGTHQELLKKQGFYYELYNNQALLPL